MVERRYVIFDANGDAGAGAVDVAEHWFGGSPNAAGQASIESIVAADPDFIVAMRVADAEDMRGNPQWKNIGAVRNGRVYANPRGLFRCGRVVRAGSVSPARSP